MANKISVVLDLVTDKAVSGLKGFKASVNDADGAVGKMKAGAGAAFDSIKAHASQLALAGGAALVAFAAKGVTAFTDLALEAGKFRDVSGASLDEASKWIAVGDDIGVSGDQISSAWNKMNIAIGAGKPLLKEYGVELKKTADGQVDANATFLNAIDVINGIKDPTKKAELAAATFGKGWTSMSELIEQGSGTITAAMAEVSDAQIIDDAELAKAKKFRESMDKLGDSVKDLAMELGEELTPAAATAADTLAELAPIAAKMAGGVGDAFVEMTDMAYEFGEGVSEAIDNIPWVDLSGPVDLTLYEIAKLERASADLVAEFDDGAPTMLEFGDRLRAAGIEGTELSLALNEYKSQLDAANEATGDAVTVTDELIGSTETSTLAHWDAAESIDAKARSDEAAADAAKAHTDAMNDQIEATTALVGGDIAVRDAQLAASEAVADATLTQDQQAEALIRAATAAAGYDEELAASNGTVLDAQGKQDLLRSKLEDLASTLAPGSPLRLQIQGYIDDLNSIPKDIQTRVFVTGNAASGVPIHVPEFATGGTVPGPTGRPMWAIVHGGEEVLTPAQQMLSNLTSANMAGWGGTTGGTSSVGGGVTIVVEGNIYGDKHLRSQLDQWAHRVDQETRGAA